MISFLEYWAMAMFRKPVVSTVQCCFHGWVLGFKCKCLFNVIR
jgi:hypothetical protein